MAKAIIGGLVSTGFPPSSIIVYEPNTEAARMVANEYKIQLAATNTDAVEFKPVDSVTTSGTSDVVVLAVKPQIMKIVCQGLLDVVQKCKPMVVSIAAGIRIESLDSWLGGNVSIVRTMPNTPALVGEGATGLYANQITSPNQKQVADDILGAISARKYWVETEDLLDVVTGLSGSGPAYFFLMIESLEDAAVSLGLPRDIARGLAIQTCLGAGKMAANSDVDPSELRSRVTSPNGTTEAGVNTAESLGIRDLWMKAVTEATNKGKELGLSFK